MKKIIRLTENDLHRIIENSVKRIIKESYYDETQLESDNEDINKLGDEYWSDHEDRKKAEKYPYLYKKDGKEIRSAKEIEKYMNNRSKGGYNRVADQERLNRKNSLNREL